MFIEEDLLIQPHTQNNHPEPQDLSGHRADVDFFTSSLQGTTPATNGAQRLSVIDLLVEASAPFAASNKRLARSLKAVGRDGNEQELANLPNQISNNLFLSQILVKCLGKTTQGIDKICNMQ